MSDWSPFSSGYFDRFFLANSILAWLRVTRFDRTVCLTANSKWIPDAVSLWPIVVVKLGQVRHVDHQRTVLPGEHSCSSGPQVDQPVSGQLTDERLVTVFLGLFQRFFLANSILAWLRAT